MIPAFIFCKNFEKILNSRRDISIFVFFKTNFFKKNFPQNTPKKNFDQIFGIFSKFNFFNEKIFLTSFTEFFSIAQMASNLTFFTYHLHLFCIEYKYLSKSKKCAEKSQLPWRFTVQFQNWKFSNTRS